MTSASLIVHVDLENISCKKLPDLSKFIGSHNYVVTYNARVPNSDDKFLKFRKLILNTYPNVMIYQNVIDKPITKDLCDNHMIDYMITYKDRLSGKLNILYTTDKELINRSKEIYPDILTISNTSPKYMLDTKISVKKFASKYNQRILKEDTIMNPVNLPQTPNPLVSSNTAINAVATTVPQTLQQSIPKDINYSFKIDTDAKYFNTYENGVLKTQYTIPDLQKGRIQDGFDYHPIIPFTSNSSIPVELIQEIKTTLPIKPLFNNLYRLAYKGNAYIFYLVDNEYSLMSNPDDLEVFSMLLTIALIPYDKPLEVSLHTKMAVASHSKFVKSEDKFTLNLQVNYILDYSFVNKLKVGLSKDALTNDIGFVAYLPIGLTNIPVITRGDKLLLEVTESTRNILKLITGGF